MKNFINDFFDNKNYIATKTLLVLNILLFSMGIYNIMMDEWVGYFLVLNGLLGSWCCVSSLRNKENE